MKENKTIVYQTTNLVNGKIYIGVRTLGHASDSTYLGSGTALLRAVKKYGRDKFERTTLFEFNTREEAGKKEAELVDSEFCARSDTYNIRTGGGNGFTVTDKSRIIAGNRLESKIEKIRETAKARRGVALSTDHKNKISAGLVGRICSESTKRKLSGSMKTSIKHIQTRQTNADAQRGNPRPQTTGGLNGMSKKCMVDGVLYQCKTDAINNTKWTNRILKRILNNPDISLSKLSVSKNLDKGAQLEWVGKTPRELGFYYID